MIQSIVIIYFGWYYYERSDCFKGVAGISLLRFCLYLCMCARFCVWQEEKNKEKGNLGFQIDHWEKYPSFDTKFYFKMCF